ncbi:hypothetical protein [Sporolactobacillus sp. KGMB 08714]|uniref:hypothetical protein n=1 Tax=Sporolactobacillus sp. KGMB 08714 TaxID=3064704 RepID=UPI002FBDF882
MSYPFSVGRSRLSVWDEGFGRHSRFFGQLGLGFDRHRQFFGRRQKFFGLLGTVLSVVARSFSIVTFVLSTMASNDRCGSLLIAETLFFFREMTVSERVDHQLTVQQENELKRYSY